MICIIFLPSCSSWYFVKIEQPAVNSTEGSSASRVLQLARVQLLQLAETWAVVWHLNISSSTKLEPFSKVSPAAWVATNRFSFAMVSRTAPRRRTFEESYQINIFIGPESDHWLCLSLTHSLTHWLTDCRLVNLIDVTLVCEDGNSKLVEVVTVVDADDEDRVGNSMLEIWKLRNGHKAKVLFRLWAQGLVNILSSGKVFNLEFGQYFAADVWPMLQSWI